MSRQPNNAPVPRTISHTEVEELLSARLDAPIDPYDNRALLNHLQSCHSCRAFAIQMEVMARDLEALPRLPASPAVRREVHNRIQTPPPFWGRISPTAASGGLGRALPAALAAMVLLVALTTWVLVELTNSGSGGVGSNGGSISAPGDVAIVLTPSEESPTGEAAAVDSEDSTATARVVLAPAEGTNETTTITGLSTVTPSAEIETEPDDPALAQALPSATSQGQTTAASTKTSPETPVTSLAQGGGPAESTTPEIAAAGINSTFQEDSTSTTEPATETPSPPTPSPTQTATSSPEPSATEDVPTPTSTREPIPTDTATSTVPPATNTPQPTETPQPTSTPTLDPTATSTLEPTPLPTETPTASPKPTETPTITPTPTEMATPTEEAPQGEPTIAPRISGEVEQSEGLGAAGSEPADPSSESGEESSSPPISPSNGQAIESNVAETPEAAEVEETPTEGSFGGQTSLLLDSSPVITDLGAGVSAPNGRLEFRTGMDLFCVTLSDGSLGIASQSGSVLLSLGAGIYPIWSPQGFILLYADIGSGTSRIMTWDSETGEIYPGGAGDERITIDTPAGWSGERYYYQRTFPESPGEIEFHSAFWDGSDDQIVWASSDIYPVSSRPIATGDGFLFATESSWMVVSANGEAWEVGANPYGSIGVVMMGPGRTMIAYTAGSEILVANAESPGSPLGSMPFTGGFDFATSGEAMVVSNGSSLDIYSIYGEYQGAASGSNSTGPPYWSDNTIYYLDLGGSTTLRTVSSSEFLDQ